MTDKHNNSAHSHDEAPRMSRYEEALAKYDTKIADDDVRAAVRKLIAEKVHENDTPEVKRFLMGSIELWPPSASTPALPRR